MLDDYELTSDYVREEDLQAVVEAFCVAGMPLEGALGVLFHAALGHG